MHKQDKIDCRRLEKGFEFPVAECDLDEQWVARYLAAVDQEQGEGTVTPMAAATYAMSFLGKVLDLPPGSIHVSQSFDFQEGISVGDHIVCNSKVARIRPMGEMTLMAFEITIVNQHNRQVLQGNMDVMLAGPAVERG